MKKKFRPKWFRAAVEGATTDGRQIDRQWLVDAAETTARVCRIGRDTQWVAVSSENTGARR